MKKSFLIVTAAMALILAGCAKTSDITNLQSQIDEIKSDKIATIHSQVSNINNSITSLQNEDKALKGFITTLQQQREDLVKADEKLAADIRQIEKDLETAQSTLNGNIETAKNDVLAQLNAYKTAVDNQINSLDAAIENLQNEDEALQKQITELKTYVDTQLQSTKDWASATFATLAQYNTTAGIVASIQGQIEAINSQIEELKETVVGVTKKDLEDAISALDTSLQGKIGKAVDDCNAAISFSEEKITAAYKAAISKAISDSEASLKSWVNNQLKSYYTAAQMDAKLEALTTDLEGKLNTQKTYLQGLINGLQTTLTNKIENNKTLIDALQSQVNQINADLSTLAGKVAINTTNISNNAKAISDNAIAISQNASDIDACEKLISANKKLIDENVAAIAANASAISALQTRATADEKNIADNAAAIAKNAAAIAKNGELIAANATAISNNAKAIGDNAAEIVQLKADLLQAKADITAAYTSAIGTAISELDGKLSGRIATEVETLNGRIDTEVQTINAAIAALTTRVATCEKDIKSIKQTIYGMQQDIEELQEQVSAILARIQSISFVPKYSDGKAIMTYTDNGTITPGTAEFDFELKPSSTAVELAKVWQNAVTVSAVYTITKAAPETVALTVENVTADNGYITVVVSGKGLKDEYFKSQCSANVRLSISDGNNDKVSEYIQMVPWTTDVISFADAAFKAYLVENFDTSGDGEISAEEAEAVTEISASMLNITSVAGIEYFKNLTGLDLSYNKLSGIDLSHSRKLKSIDVSGNKIAEINIAGLSELVTLDCSANKIEVLNVSESKDLKVLNCNNNQIGSLVLNNNKELTELQCNGNNLTALNLRNNTLLETLYCRKNSISVLDVTKMTALKNLDCSSNVISSLNLYQNTLLETLYCSSNNLANIGVTANVQLAVLDCSKNQLASLDVTKNILLETLDCSDNNLGNLDVSRNASLETLTTTGNAAMAKIWVKDTAQKDAITFKKDVATTIAFNDGGIQIPDANLKKYLLALFDDDEDGEISILEAENVQNVNCSGRSISDLTGLQDCPNLKYLNFSGNSVREMNLPNLAHLEEIVAYGNPIEKIDVDNDVALTKLYLQNVSTNALSGDSFTINAYDQAETLYLAFAGTGYTTLNLTGSEVLKSYDIAENVQLTKLVASGNSLVTEVNVASLTALTDLDINACGLTSLNVDTNLDLVNFDCSSNKIASLNVNNNVNLVNFDCSDNLLATLRITNNTLLEKVDAGFNQLSNLNVRQNTRLKDLSVASNNEITALALGYNRDLETLNVSATSLAALDVTNNTELAALDVSNATALTTLSGFSLSSKLSVSAGLKPSIYHVGQYVSIDGQIGVVFQESTAKIVSTDQHVGTWREGESWCSEKGDVWQLTTENELKAIREVMSTLNDTLFIVSGSQFYPKSYWTSNGRYVNLDDGISVNPSNKSFSLHIRAVRPL